MTARRVVAHAHAEHRLLVALTAPEGAWWRDAATGGVIGRPGVGDVLVWPASQELYGGWKGRWAAVSVRLPVGLVGRVAVEAGLGGARLRPTVIRQDDFLVESARALAKGRSGRAGVVFEEGLGAAVVVRVLERAGVKAPGLGEEALERLQQLVEDELGGDLRVERLAGEVGLSRWHFSRVFAEAVGCAPHRWVTERRLERARELLATTARPLVAIALEVGYSSQSHLTAQFRRRYGVTPGAFRARASQA